MGEEGEEEACHVAWRLDWMQESDGAMDAAREVAGAAYVSHLGLENDASASGLVEVVLDAVGPIRIRYSAVFQTFLDALKMLRTLLARRLFSGPDPAPEQARTTRTLKCSAFFLQHQRQKPPIGVR